MNSHAPPHYLCPFCRIVRGDFGSDLATTADEIVLRTKDITAFVASDQWPGNPGHVIIVTNRHFENLYSLPRMLAAPLQEAAQSIALALKRAFDCPGTSTRQHNEPAGGQDVWHYHLHVFPRYPEDRLYGSERRPVPRDDRIAQANSIRGALSGLIDA